MITRYGYDVFLTITLLCVLALVVALLLVDPKALRYAIVGLSVLLWGFSVNFFRDPDRSTPAGDGLVIAPADGKVIAVRTVQEGEYVQAEYFAAFEDKASEKNEQMIIGIEHARGKMLFKQIAGFVARRIVCTLKPGDPVKAGERFGMIKFGSRIDVFVPMSAVVRVRVGDVSVAGETVLAEFR